ncbi:MAG: head decoration protein [Betaproteobacteria bacterium]|nr:head decoration protein [Betaproteobacteria bacterium]
MNQILKEGLYTAEFLLSEGNGQISREGVTVVAGDALEPGQVLGIETASGKYAPYGSGGGADIAVGILYSGLPASAEERDGVAVVRLAEVAAARLTGLDGAATADLKTRNIIVR